MYDLKKCPYCSEDINIELTKCPNCNQWLPSDKNVAAKQTLLEQNYPMGRFLALALFVVTLSTNRIVLHFLNLAYEEAVFISQIINLGIKVWLLFLLMQYLLNFKLLSVRRDIVWIMISNIVMVIVSSSMVAFHKNITGYSYYYMAIPSFINLFATIVYVAGLVVGGLNLVRFKGDWVGGLNALGKMFLIIAVLVPLSFIMTIAFQYIFAGDVETQLLAGGLMNAATNILMAIGMYRVFVNAEKYENNIAGNQE